MRESTASAEHNAAASTKKPQARPGRLAVLWNAQHPSTSRAEMSSLPTLFWLMAELRPACTVQIGLGAGTALLGLSQAVKKARIDGRVIAYAHEGEELNPSEVTTLASDYAEITSTCALDTAGKQKKTTPINLLVLRHPLKAAARKAWLPRLASDAVVLAHFPAGNERQRHVEALLDDMPLGARRISLRCDEEHVELLLTGDSLPENISQLGGTGPEAEATRLLLQRLAQLNATRVTLGLQNARLEAQQAEISAAQASEMQQLGISAELKARLFDLEQRLQQVNACAEANEALRAQLTSAEQTIAKDHDRIVKRDLALARMADALEEQRINLAVHTERSERHQHELLALTTALQKLEKSANERLERAKSAKKRLLEAEALIAEQREHIASLYTSTSWRLTAPVRGIKIGLNRLRGR